MSYTADEIRDHLCDAITEARNMLEEARNDLDSVESCIDNLECEL
jgi:hypothetical protein